MDNRLSHADDNGAARMVDVSDKAVTRRSATASGRIRMNHEALCAIRENTLRKGEALSVARVAAIFAAKKVDELIPLCHTLPVSSVDVSFEFEEGSIVVAATVVTNGRTGVEMEALTACAVAALTIYDMAKSVDRSMTIGDIKLLQKSGGRSGDYISQEEI